MWSILTGSARRYGERIAFRRGAATLSFTQLADRAHRFAAALAVRGVGRGARVAVVLPNCLEYPVAYFGIQLAGATFVPVNPLLPADARAAQLADAGAIFTVLPGVVDELVAATPDGVAGAEVDVYADLAHISYTGGTTGLSKGVRLPHRNVVVNSLQSACWITGALPALDGHGGLVVEQLDRPDEWPVRHGTGIAITLTPWFHAMGTIGGLTVPMLTGTTVVLHDRFDPVAYLADAQRLGVTQIAGAPTLVTALLHCPAIRTTDLSTVRTISTGAAPLAVETITELRRLLPDVVIGEGYGLTEVTMSAAVNPNCRSGLRKIGSVGPPTFDTELKIVPAEGGEDPLPTGERGEVCVRGPQVMTGYHNRPDETAAVLVAGWLHTGDLGFLDEDGYLSIVDRKKDMLLYKGYNVYPRELEELLVALPDVAAAAVVGRPDPVLGELPVAFVVAAAGTSPDADALMAAVNARVVPYKRLRELRVVPTIPVSAAGKVLKRELRERLS